MTATVNSASAAAIATAATSIATDKGINEEDSSSTAQEGQSRSRGRSRAGVSSFPVLVAALRTLNFQRMEEVKVVMLEVVESVEKRARAIAAASVAVRRIMVSP